MQKRLIVISDSHGDADGLKAAVEQARSSGKVDAVVFLGDGMRDYESVLPSLQADRIACYAVRGNNDWSSQAESEITFTLNGVRIFACHGHTRQVKYSTDRLWYAAQEREARVVLYGHTHREKIDLEYGIYLINPGAVCERSSRRSAYAEVMIEDNGFVQAGLVKWKN